MLDKTGSNDDSSELNDLIKELEKETLPEDSSSNKTEKIKDIQAKNTIKDMKNSEGNNYEYSEDLDLSDTDW